LFQSIKTDQFKKRPRGRRGRN